METKRCARCGKEKPTTEFRVAKRRRKVGLFSWCRPCCNEYQQARYVSLRPPKPPEGFKRCPRCKEIKPVADFLQAKSRADGLRPYCRPCWAKVNQDSSRRYRKTEKYRQQLKLKRLTPENKHKHWVHTYTLAAIKLGILIPQPCEIQPCTEPVQAHHTDYAKPLAVRWLCRGHHQSHGHNGDFDNPPQ